MQPKILSLITCMSAVALGFCLETYRTHAKTPFLNRWPGTLSVYPLFSQVTKDAQRRSQFSPRQPAVADMIIFSYDRPLQLYALLESIDVYIAGLNDIGIIYRASSPAYQKAYEECFNFYNKKLPNLVHVFKQGSDARKDFKPLTLQLLNALQSDYLLFAVDDIVIKDSINLADCVQLLDKTGAHGFYLRLGKNIVECYTQRTQTPVPPCIPVGNGAYSFTFQDGKGDWGYPSSLDMTLFRKSQVMDVIPALPFTSPNLLEYEWTIEANGWFGKKPRDMHKKGLFYDESKIVNVPLNVVQTDNSRAYHMGYPKEYLLARFQKGYKLDINRYHKLANKAPHREIEPVYSKRH